MGTSYNPPIVTDGLVFCVDAANQRSYPKSGTTWSDLIGSNDGAMQNMEDNYSSDNGGVLSFDGANEYIDYGDIHSGLNNISVFSWVNPSSLSEEPILVKGMGAVGNREFALYILSNKCYAVVADESIQDVDSVSGSTVLSTSTWYNLGMVWNGSTLKVYVNGSEDGSVATSVSSGEVEDRSSPLIIGRDTSPDYANFKLASVCLYNRALSADEVRQNYEATVGRFT